MGDAQELGRLLERLDGRGYPGYKEIKGSWEMDGFQLEVDYVQGDPFAAPSRLRAVLPPTSAGLDSWLLEERARRLGVAAWLARGFAQGAGGRHGSGSGKSGTVRMASPGQLVLPQTAVQVARDGAVEARFVVGLPARGRRILGREAAELLTRRLPDLVLGYLGSAAHPPEVLRQAAEVNEDADALRDQLQGAGLVAFVADGAVLPRASGVDDAPLGDGAVPFRSPDSLRVTLDRPNAGPISGMGIPRGVTLIVGGGFHGKSTLLRAMEAGIYNHRPGDGREAVVTLPEAVKIRAEDGRAITGVDISSFIDGLPGAQDTRAFQTRNASGSTSQAAALVEALEMGASVLLMDEDTCATNFLIRDSRMQALVPADREPITPLVDRIQELHQQEGVSALLVLGGSGDYLDVADTVITMDSYRPLDVTLAAREIARDRPTGRGQEPRGPLRAPEARHILPASLPPGRKGRPLRIKVLDEGVLRVGEERLDLQAVEQLLLPTQLRTVAAVLETLAVRTGGWDRPLPELLRALGEEMTLDLDAVDRRRVGDLAWIRPVDVAAALNRLRTLQVRT